MQSRAEDLFREISDKTPEERTAFVEAWVTNKQMEEEYLEFKTSGGEAKDSQTWSKCLSSFANTETGLLVWGIDARPQKGPNPEDRAIDCAFDWKPIKDTKQHVQFLKDMFRDSLNEPIHGVTHLEIASTKGTGGYVVSLIPVGRNKPYRAERMPGKPYYQRVGDSNEIIPHSFLRSLFYPQIRANLRCYARVFTGNERFAMFFISIHNNGVGTATDMVLRVFTNKHVNFISGESGFRSQEIKNAKQELKEARVTTTEPVHPGDNRPTCALSLETVDPKEYAGFQITIKAYMANQEPCFFSHKFRLEDMSYGDTHEIERVEEPNS